MIVLCLQTERLQAQKDPIFFRNGSRIVGELKKIKMGAGTFDPDDDNDSAVESR